MNDLIEGMHHIGLPTGDMDATVDFYGKLGAKVVFETKVMEGDQPVRVVHLQLSNLLIEAYERDSIPGVPGAVDHIAFEVNDIGEAFRRAQALHLRFVKEEIGVSDYWPTPTSWFHVIGPSGERIEFEKA